MVTILGGDWNCVIRYKGVEPCGSGCVLGVLRDVLQDAGVSDVVGREGGVEHMFVRRGYAARLDRIYVTTGIMVERVQTIDVGFSDHRAVMAELAWFGMVWRYSGYWKLNVWLLTA